MTDETCFVPATTGAQLARITASLRAAWEQNRWPWPWDVSGAEALSEGELVSLVQLDHAEHWRRQRPKRIDDYFAARPALLQSPTAATALIEHEFNLRQQLGQQPSWEEYRQRFPQWTPPATILQAKSEMVSGSEMTILPATARADETILPGVPRSGDRITSQEDTLLPGRTPAAQDTLLNLPPGFDRDPPPPAAESSASPAPLPEIPGYEIVSELGRGGMGVVYKARQVRAERDVALKVIRPDMLSLMEHDTQSNTIGRFRHEARAAGRLLHDNIVTVYEVGEWNSYHYYAMRMVEGPSLIQLVRERPLENRLAAGYLAGTARGVQFAHEQGILHRDLKPHNVLIDARSQRPLVADFGLAKFTADTNELTRAGDVIGTPSYMSPEQARDSSTVTALSDVYSLGATLYHVLAGRPPFQAANLGETLRQIMHEEPLPPRQLNPAIDADLETICLKCLQKEPGRRYSSCATLADDLERYLRGEPILARPVSTQEKLVRWCRRNPALAAAMGAVALLTVVAVSSIVWGYVETVVALGQANRNFNVAAEAIDDLLTEASEDVLMSQPGMQEVRRKLLLSAQRHYRQLLDVRPDNPVAQFRFANAAYRVGDIKRLFQEYDEANELYRIAEENQRELLALEPTNPDYQLALSNTLNAQGQRLFEMQQYPIALERWQEAVAMRDAVASSFADDAEFVRKQANMHMNLGLVHMRLGNGLESLEKQQQGQQLRSAALQREAENEKLRNDFAKGAFNLARTHLAMAGDSSSPEEYNAASASGVAELQNAITQFQKLLQGAQRRHPVYRQQLVQCYQLLVMYAPDPGPLYAEALPVARSLVDDNAVVEEYCIPLADLLLNYAGYLLVNMREPELLEVHAEIERLLEPISKKSTSACDLAASNQFYWASRFASDPATAREHLLRAQAYWQQFKKLGGDASFANAELAKVEAELAKTSAPPSVEEASR